MAEQEKTRYCLILVALTTGLAMCAGCGNPSSLRVVHYSNQFNEPSPEHDVVEGRSNVVVAVHGWTSDPDIAFREGKAPWNNPGMRTALDRLLESQGNTGDWDIWGLDWREGAAIPEGSNSKAMPCTANEINAQVQGQWIAKTLLDHNEYDHVHLIGHSLGGRVIETASTMIKQVMPNATIHTTFLDAYSAYTWDRVFGSTADFTDHYYSSNDWLVRMTNESFPAALNVDISTIVVPFDEHWEWGEQSWGHNAPVWFYRDTSLDPELDRYQGYGIALGREFLGEAWPPTGAERGTGQLVTLTLGADPTLLETPSLEEVPGSTFQATIRPDDTVDTFGQVETTEELTTLSVSPDSPISWVVFQFETTTDTNSMEFEFNWSDTAGAGRMMFFIDDEALWGTEPQTSLDRWASSGRVMWTGMVVRVPTEASLDSGTHELAFKLDMFTGTSLSIQVRGPRGSMLALPEPAPPT